MSCSVNQTATSKHQTGPVMASAVIASQNRLDDSSTPDTHACPPRRDTHEAEEIEINKVPKPSSTSSEQVSVSVRQCQSDGTLAQIC